MAGNLLAFPAGRKSENPMAGLCHFRSKKVCIYIHIYIYWKVNFGVYPIFGLTYIYYIWKHKKMKWRPLRYTRRAGSWDASCGGTKGRDGKDWPRESSVGCVGWSQTPATNVQNPEDLLFKVVLSLEKCVKSPLSSSPPRKKVDCLPNKHPTIWQHLLHVFWVDTGAAGFGLFPWRLKNDS